MNTGLLHILHGSDLLRVLDLKDLLGVLAPLEQFEPEAAMYLNFEGVASLHGPVAPWNVCNEHMQVITIFQ